MLVAECMRRCRRASCPDGVWSIVVSEVSSRRIGSPGRFSSAAPLPSAASAAAAVGTSGVGMYTFGRGVDSSHARSCSPPSVVGVNERIGLKPTAPKAEARRASGFAAAGGGEPPAEEVLPPEASAEAAEAEEGEAAEARVVVVVVVVVGRHAATTRRRNRIGLLPAALVVGGALLARVTGTVTPIAVPASKVTIPVGGRMCVAERARERGVCV